MRRKPMKIMSEWCLSMNSEKLTVKFESISIMMDNEGIISE